jgi:hypothetical protein
MMLTFVARVFSAGALNTYLLSDPDAGPPPRKTIQLREVFCPACDEPLLCARAEAECYRAPRDCRRCGIDLRRAAVERDQVVTTVTVGLR